MFDDGPACGKSNSTLLQRKHLNAAHPTRRTACLGLLFMGGSAGFARYFGGLQARETEAANSIEIADGVFVHQGQIADQAPENHGDISNAGFVIGTDAVAVIDTGGSYLAGAALRAAVAERTKNPIKYVINTHMHPDHVLGNAAFKADAAAFVAHHKMPRALTARSERYLRVASEMLGAEAFAGTQIVLPDQLVETSSSIDLGGRSLQLSAQNTAHTDNDLIVTDDKTGVAFMGDLIFSGHVPSLDGSIKGWIETLEKIGNSPAQKIVPGHGPAALSWPEASMPMLRYLNAVANDVRAIIKRGGTISEAVDTAAGGEASQWQLFEDFHKRNVSAAFAELEWE
ncbi:MAG: quinoprotein relay system zinc metallohydrolase 2 [Alphaproteobacteria bacterium]|nr:quinoprotein relay system zinc metallohydrolase 2 [Alphaproteobacteria bacterium]